MKQTSFEEQLALSVTQVLKTLDLPAKTLDSLNVVIGPPRIQAHGDLSLSVAMQLTKLLKQPPLKIAEAIALKLKDQLKKDKLDTFIQKIEVKPPGFINFVLSDAALTQTLSTVLKEKDAYCQQTIGHGTKVQVEFVSANPTGPLSVAHGRQAAVGDSLANILSFAGFEVTREYYLNDEGRQIELLGASLLSRTQEVLGESTTFPEEGYKGDYLKAIAQDIAKKDPKCTKESASWFSQAATDAILTIIRKELDGFGVKFDVWYSQKSLHAGNKQEKALDFLKKQGTLYEKEGAWWLKSTDFGDDKDRVVVRSDGRPTYIAADIAYHREKYARGFKRIINLWGPDHHGYIHRIHAAVQALGHPKDSLSILIIQLCTLKRGKETIPMSTREGEFITLSQVIKEVGKDAGRFFFLMRKSDSHLEFDLELAKKQAPENPVYYIQYAHARICNILGFQEKEQGKLSKTPDLKLLKAPQELQLMRRLRDFPNEVKSAAQHLEPQGITQYLLSLATDFHKFYDTQRVVTDDLSLTQARLALIQATQIVFANGLKLLGVSAPTRM